MNPAVQPDRLKTRFERIRTLFHDALALPPATDPVKWVELRCSDEPEMLREVVSLLEAHAGMQRASVLPPAPEPAIPTARFGAYRAVRMIGRGGMSTVYEASRADGQFQQTVALKIMASYLAGPEFLRRFEIERQFLATLSHHNITRLIDGGISSAGDPFLITEYVEGQAIDRYCDQRSLDVARRLRVFLQVCEAVDYAHRNLIVHRDLKPGNILVNAEGSVKLLDFGTAALLGVETQVTVTRGRLFTPRYASPEQLRGERVNVATDVFSLGVVLYELLSGAWPFGDPESVVSELSRALGQVPAKAPTAAVTEDAARNRSASKEQLAAVLRGDLAPVVLKALEDQPLRRYESVRQLAADIENYLAGRPVQARRQTAVYRAQRFVRRHWLPVAAAGVFVVGLSGASVVALRQAQLARAQERRALDEARKSAHVTTFLRGMLTSATQVGGADVTVIQMLNAAEPDIQKSWKDDPLAEATLRASVGATYVTLEQRDRAAQQLRKALRLFQSLGRHADAADALLVLGINAQSHTQMVGYYRQSLEELRLAGSEAPLPLLFRVKVYLAGALKDGHSDREARALVDEALPLLARAPEIPTAQKAAALEIRGETLLEDARFDEAEATFREAIAVDLHQFDAWNMLAKSSYLRERFADAAGFAHRDYELAANYGLEDKAEAEVWWARYRAETGEAGEAAAQIREAMPAVRKYFRSGYLVAYYEQPAARVWNHAGRFDQAAECARRALDALKANQIPETSPTTAASLEDLGDALCGLKRSGEGIASLERAAALYRQLGPAYARIAARVEARVAQRRSTKD